MLLEVVVLVEDEVLLLVAGLIVVEDELVDEVDVVLGVVVVAPSA
jgi:hypothetical protein